MSTGLKIPSDSFCCTDVSDPLYVEFWHAYADPFVTMPKDCRPGVLLPQGHTEQRERFLGEYAPMHLKRYPDEISPYGIT
ncbi:hypothetical protein SUGI_0553260 [Cryptomeria japonica]|nr:hypothetical protein SUGI_0553260 [Cryptomeria japonica]